MTSPGRHQAEGEAAGNGAAMTYDQWKTTDPADYYAPTCERCGCWLRNDRYSECEACADEFLAEEQMMWFYEWEPVS